MTKYTAEFKIKVAQRYFDGYISVNALATELGIAQSQIRSWVETAKVNGVKSLAPRKKHIKYTLDFKMKVVEYYRTHDIGGLKVAALFDLPKALVFKWNKLYENGGYEALAPSQKGRKPTMTRKSKSKEITPVPGEKRAYEEEIIELKAKLHEAEMERDLLKKLPLRSGLSLTKRKPKL